MAEWKKSLAAGALVIWLMIVLLFMILAQSLNLEIFFVLWLIGLLIIVELVDPAFVQPRYIRAVKYVIAAGVIIFGVIVAQKVLEIINA
jgi:hypothetical protein